MMDNARIRLAIEGMHCANCAANVEKHFHAVDGVHDVAVNLATNTGTVDFDPRVVSVDALLHVFDDMSFTAELIPDDAPLVDDVRRAREAARRAHDARVFALSLVLTCVIVLICMVPGVHMAVGSALASVFFAGAASGAGTAGTAGAAGLAGAAGAVGPTTLQCMFCANVLIMLLDIPVQFGCGARFYKGAWGSLKSGSANMDVLVALGTSIAFLFSLWITFVPAVTGDWNASVDTQINDGMPYFETCAMLITFVMLGKILETRAKGATSEAIESLMNLVPPTAIVVRGGERREVPLAHVVVGDTVLVRAGDKVPVDGVVRAGCALLDESMMTGESTPVLKRAGDEVTGGTLVVSTETDTESSSFVVSTEVDAKGKSFATSTEANAADEQAMDTASNEWGDLAALALSTKAHEFAVQAMRVGADSTLAHIVRAVEDAQGSKAPVQRMADRIAAIFVPGILGLAVLTFVGWLMFGGASGMAFRIQEALLPAIAVIVVACPCALGLATPTALMVGMGKGAQLGVLIKDGEVLERLCKMRVAIFDKTGTLTVGGAGKRVLRAGETTSDELKPDTARALARLRDEFDVESFMVTGDHRAIALDIAAQAGIDEQHVFAQVDPLRKGDCVQAVRKQGALREGDVVAFVGDGVNDAPALAVADVGIAMASGTDVALDAGQVVLMRNDVTSVITALRLSRATMRKIRQNLFWALIYNVIMVPLAAFGIVAPALAGAAMACSSVCVVCNSLFLKRFE